MRRLFLCFPVALFWLLTSCGGNPVKPSSLACKNILPGDVVVTELMKDPDGADEGLEYIELYNATGKSFDLKEATLFVSRLDGSREKTHALRTSMISARGYAVFGDVAEAARPAHVMFGYGDALGNIPNAEGIVGIRCGETVIDVVKYQAPGKSGRSMSLNGMLTPDALANDEQSNFCESTEEFSPGAFGSPGARNPACGETSSNTCLDAETQEQRAVVAPQAGQLVITEFMANPSAATDAEGEWLEITALADVDLNGLEVWSGTAQSKIASPNCLPLATGAFALFAKSDNPEKNAGLPTPQHVFTIALPNSNGTLALKHGEVVVDQVTYTATADGVSTQLDPNKTDATANDDSKNFCPSTQAYGGGDKKDKGTPGAPNTLCGPPVDPNRCFDVTAGLERARVAPVVGNLVITEFMANPTGTEAQREWVEVLVKTDVDLNGLELINEGGVKTTLNSTNCIRPGSGKSVVFARSTDATINGGLPEVTGTFTFNLSNTGTRSISLHHGETELDKISYTTSADGISTQLDPTKNDPLLNDVATNFCPAPVGTTYGTGDRGSPGLANPSCPL